MPQLDKISFVTQYFWLTIFFFGLYFLTVNFFVILVFKNLKLRNMIYKILYFFIYKFNYRDYKNTNTKILDSCFNSIYYANYIGFLTIYKTLNLINNLFVSLLNKTLLCQTITNSAKEIVLEKHFGNKLISILNVEKLNKIVIDEI